VTHRNIAKVEVVEVIHMVDLEVTVLRHMGRRHMEVTGHHMVVRMEDMEATLRKADTPLLKVDIPPTVHSQLKEARGVMLHQQHMVHQQGMERQQGMEHQQGMGLQHSMGHRHSMGLQQLVMEVQLPMGLQHPHNMGRQPSMEHQPKGRMVHLWLEGHLQLLLGVTGHQHSMAHQQRNLRP